MDNGFDPMRSLANLPESVATFISASLLSSLAGIANLLRISLVNKTAITFLAVLSATINSGLIGLTISLMWYKYFREQDNIAFLTGICVLAGLLGNKSIDMIFAMWKKGGITVNFPSGKNVDTVNKKDGDDNEVG